MPIPTFTQGYPQDGQSLGASKAVIRNNLDGMFQVFSVEHNTQNVLTNTGLHRQSTYPAASGRPTTTTGQINIYSRAITGGTALFTSRDNNSATVTQISNPYIISPLSASEGYSYLPGGLIIQWGLRICEISNVGAQFNVTFPTPFPHNCYNVQCTPLNNQDTNSQCTVAPRGFITSVGTVTGVKVWTVLSSQTLSYSNFYWVAIGN